MTLTSNDIPILYNTTIRYCTYGGLYFSLLHIRWIEYLDAASNTNVRTANLSISIRTSHDDVMRPISPPSDPFTNDPQSNGTSYPILWRVHGPTPHNWRCFGLDVARRCYLLIEYIILLAIALYWRLLSSSHHNHYRDSYSGALELQPWRHPIQIKPDYAHSDPIPFLCLDPHSIVLKSKWQSMAESISIHTKRPQQPRASHSTYHI
eukprot:563144_1